ncbi:hypothetical protein KC221_31425, partial [Mycobacterium tuberculosis]|nr:hypothetical protein [Mycobacterium tuberculosis]
VAASGAAGRFLSRRLVHPLLPFAFEFFDSLARRVRKDAPQFFCGNPHALQFGCRLKPLYFSITVTCQQ